jgi:UDP-N-acetylmuramate--alanine ligase
MRRIQRLHFVGIGGAGMSGIAEVLLNLGYTVTGSDLKSSAAIERLQTLKAKIILSHQANNVEGADVVVQSSAITEDNAEIVHARALRIPIVARAEMLAELMRFHYGIAIAGTHGKTTTTSLVTSLLSQGGLDPTFVIGGRLNSAGANARLGESHYFVVEADESDASFLYLKPMVSVVTNIDKDHLENYIGDFNRYQQTFLQFLHHLPFYGLAVLCFDDPYVRALLPKVGRPVMSYGFSQEADVRITHYQQNGLSGKLTFCGGYWEKPITVVVNLPGEHNALNAVAAAIVAKECGVSDEAIQQGLAAFAGVGRRFQVYGDLSFPQGEILLVDDYGHHPREMAVTISAAKQAWPNRRLTLLFQPHRYSRTHALFSDFISTLKEVDQVFLLDIYSAGEKPIEGISSLALCEALKREYHKEAIYISDHTQLTSILQTYLRQGDVLLTQGAGSVGAIAAELNEKFSLGNA